MAERCELSYEPKRRQFSRKSARRLLISILLISATSFVILFGKPIYFRVKLFYWVSVCSRYTQSADVIVWGDAQTNPHGHRWSSTLPSVYTGVVFVDRFEAPDFCEQIRCWNQLMLLLNPSGKSEATLFLHELVSRSGHRRLVAVGAQDLEPIITVIAPGNLLQKSVIISRGFAAFKKTERGLWYESITRRPGPRFYFGSVDPSDPSHFTLHFEVAHIPVYFDGWFQDDDTIRMAVHDPEDLQKAFAKNAIPWADPIPSE
jgi:hypothetical protein